MCEIDLSETTKTHLVVIATDDEIEILCYHLSIPIENATEGEYESENRYHWTVKLN